MDLLPIRMPAALPKAGTPSPADAAAKEVAQQFEAAFLSEMLKYTGLNAPSASFGGGAGEDAFASFLTDEYARLLAQRGGIGLAEKVFELLKQRTTSA